MQASEQSTVLLRHPLNGCRKISVGRKSQWVVDVKESGQAAADQSFVWPRRRYLQAGFPLQARPTAGAIYVLQLKPRLAKEFSESDAVAGFG